MPREARAQRNSNLFREVNERIRQLQTRSRFETDRVGFVCECRVLGCTTPVYLTSAEYSEARGTAGCFVVAPAHVDPDRERVIIVTEQYAVVERLTD